MHIAEVTAKARLMRKAFAAFTSLRRDIILKRVLLKYPLKAAFGQWKELSSICTSSSFYD